MCEGNKGNVMMEFFLYFICRYINKMEINLILRKLKYLQLKSGR